MDQITGRQFERTEILIGEKKLKLLAESRIAIFGLGGVGSFAIEGLVRSGINKFLLIDFDKICYSNFNRQIMATEKAIGINKVDIMKERINSINSRAEVLSLSEFLNIETIENILKETQKIDFCIEAIDSLNPKTKVIKSLLKYNIPFISSMGAGGRISPFMVKEGTLNEVKTCDLAKRLKKKLKKEHINIEEIKVVYSTEKAKKPVARQTWEEGEFQRGRIRGKQGSICFVPAVFGMCMAYIAIRYITEKIDF